MYGSGQPHVHIIYIQLGLAKSIHIYVYTVYVRYIRQRNHHTYGHIRCVYKVLANPIYNTCDRKYHGDSPAKFPCHIIGCLSFMIFWSSISTCPECLNRGGHSKALYTVSSSIRVSTRWPTQSIALTKQQCGWPNTDAFMFVTVVNSNYRRAWNDYVIFEVCDAFWQFWWL